MVRINAHLPHTVSIWYRLIYFYSRLLHIAVVMMKNIALQTFLDESHALAKRFRIVSNIKLVPSRNGVFFGAGFLRYIWQMLTFLNKLLVLDHKKCEKNKRHDFFEFVKSVWMLEDKLTLSIGCFSSINVSNEMEISLKTIFNDIYSSSHFWGKYFFSLSTRWMTAISCVELQFDSNSLQYSEERIKWVMRTWCFWIS